MRPTRALLDIYVAPKQVFCALPENKRLSWLAIGAIVLVNVFALWLFYSPMDGQWIVEQQVAQISGSLSTSEADQARQVLEKAAGNIFYISLGGFVISTALMLLLMALYAMLVGNQGKKRAYSDWLAFSSWVAMPSLLSALGFIALIALSSNPNMPLTTANYLSVNQLFLGFEPGNSWYRWAESFNTIYFWFAGLAAIGLRVWSGYTIFKAAALAFLPIVVVFGTWAIFI